MIGTSRSSVAAAAALVISGLALIASLPVPSARLEAIVVFDPTNYGQNLLTAARALDQVNNQIRMLQNQTQGLLNQAKNLTTIGFPELTALTGTIRQVDDLMAQAQGLQFRISGFEQQYQRLFPATGETGQSMDQHLLDAKSRVDAAMAAYKQTMTVQARITENIQTDTDTLTGIATRSQGAEGALQATQATNQLLALVAKQQFQMQTLLAAQYRAQAIDEATRSQQQSDAQAATTRFLGSGSAYTPH